MKNKKIVVGKSPTKLKLFFMMLACAFLALLFGNFLCISLQAPTYFPLIFGIIFLVFALLYIPTFAGSYTYWTVDEAALTYYSSPDFRREIAYTMAILCNQKRAYTMRLQTCDIMKIDVYWTSRFFIWASRMYPVMLGIEMRDGTLIRFEALYEDKEVFVEALQYLQDIHHIRIHDPYHLLEVMKDSKKSLYEYIDEIMKRKKGDDTHA